MTISARTILNIWESENWHKKSGFLQKDQNAANPISGETILHILAKKGYSDEPVL